MLPYEYTVRFAVKLDTLQSLQDVIWHKKSIPSVVSPLKVDPVSYDVIV